MLKVKVCGLMEIEHARAAAEAGADFIGLVFAPSRRKVSPEKAAALAAAARQANPSIAVVGVFAGVLAKEVNRVSEFIGADWVQLSGGETWEFCREIKFPLIKVIHVSAGTRVEQVIEVIEQGNRSIGDGKLICLLDSSVPGEWGGTGRSFDWQVAGELSRRFPVMVAGGLNMGNVGRLIRDVKPWGVDVSTGVETGGQKDPAKIRAFIAAVRAAEPQTGVHARLSGGRDATG